MKITKTLLAAAIALLPLTALAGGSVDVFYTNNEHNVDGQLNADGNGYGFRGQAELGKGFSMIGLHQSSKVKPDIGTSSSNKLSETRIGLSYGHQLNKQFNLTGSLESVQFDVENGKNTGKGTTLDGYAANIGVNTNIIDKLNGNLSVGYINLGKLNNERVSGYEYTAGLSYDLCKNWAGLVEYRAIRLETNNNDIDNNTLRVGARYTF